MEWLIILALAGWAWWQAWRLNALTQRLDALEQRVAAEAAMAPTQSHAQAEAGVLVLDTPVPAASNDERAPPPPDDEQPWRPLAAHAPQPEANDAEALLLTEVLTPDAARPAPPRRFDGKSLEQWLARNALAWLAGGAFAIGGIMLVAFAAQQSWFTPLVRLYCALALGLALIGASEWVLRRPNAHKLIAALLAGAGCATFYAAAWAGHALYGFIDRGAAAAALALCALLLIGLSFRHGQPLGVLAVMAALFAPALTDAADWAPITLTLYLCGVAAAGFTLAALRRWSWVAAATLVGLYFWFAGAIAADNVRRALALLSFASLGGVALAFRAPQPEAEAAGRLAWPRLRTLAPTIAICCSSVALIWAWLGIAPASSGSISGTAWVGAMFVALAGAAIRARVAPAPVLSVAIAALVSGFMIYLSARSQPLGGDFYPFILFAAAAVMASAIGARPHRRDRLLVAVSGGAGAAILTALAAATRADWHAVAAWAPLFVGALALGAAAWLAARNALLPRSSGAVDAWALSAAALALLGVEALFPAAIRPAGHAGLALALAAMFAWQGWRALSWGALGAAALALAHAFSDALAGAVLSADATLAQAWGVLAIGAGALFAGAFICARWAKPASVGEALSSAAIILLLLGAYLTLRWFAAGPSAFSIDPLTEAALGVLTLLAAGHLVMPKPGQKLGRIALLRAHVLMALGFVYFALSLCFTLNPWWGAFPAAVAGPPLVGPIALAYAAPAAFFIAAEWRLYPSVPIAARIYAAIGGVIALGWTMLEVRWAFHPADMDAGGAGVLEGAIYGLLMLTAAFVVTLIARVRRGALGQDMSRIARGVAWAGLFVGGWLILAEHHPWWGGGVEANALTSALSVLAQLVAMMLALLIGRMLSVSAFVSAARFAAASAAVLFAWSFGHAAIRWIYYRDAMSVAPMTGLEGFLHALWPLAFVLVGAWLTMRAPGRDTVRAYLHDLQAIWASAVWPATAFAAFGLWALFNPWWGVAPIFAGAWPISAGAAALTLIAAGMTLLAPRVPHLALAKWFAPAARVAAATHLFIAATLLVRAGFHGGAIAPGGSEGAELWTYSAVWALFGAGALTYGTLRNDAVLRWYGLGMLFATAAKVLALDTARLSGMIRVASFLAFGAVAAATALAMHRLRQTPEA